MDEVKDCFELEFVCVQELVIIAEFYMKQIQKLDDYLQRLPKHFLYNVWLNDRDEKQNRLDYVLSRIATRQNAKIGQVT